MSREKMYSRDKRGWWMSWIVSNRGEWLRKPAPLHVHDDASIILIARRDNSRTLLTHIPYVIPIDPLLRWHHISNVACCGYTHEKFADETIRQMALTQTESGILHVDDHHRHLYHHDEVYDVKHHSWTMSYDILWHEIKRFTSYDKKWLAHNSRYISRMRKWWQNKW